jgi:hypothetical protein
MKQGDMLIYRPGLQLGDVSKVIAVKCDNDPLFEIDFFFGYDSLAIEKYYS